MNQLNFPVFGLDTSRGMTSEVLPLRDASGRTVYTGWQRRLLGSGRVIYTGFYSTVQVPDYPSRCVKVVFPLPRGNATVILRPELDDEGRFRLVSRGKRFDVYTDEQGTLRCDHVVRFLGITMLRLHYRMVPRPQPFTPPAPHPWIR